MDDLDKTVLEMVTKERARQDELHGPQGVMHSTDGWRVILKSELAEIDKAIALSFTPEKVLEEMVQSAAVLCAWARYYVERVDYNKKADERKTKARKYREDKVDVMIVKWCGSFCTPTAYAVVPVEDPEAVLYKGPNSACMNWCVDEGHKVVEGEKDEPRKT